MSRHILETAKDRAVVTIDKCKKLTS